MFGPRGDEPLDADVVRAKFAALAAEIERATGEAQPPEAVAEGFIASRSANMANAIKFISVQRGHDVTRYTLGCFGGAGGQHACLVADELGMTRVFIHPLAGVLSAYGMGLADQYARCARRRSSARSKPRRSRALEEALDDARRARRAGELRGPGRARGSASSRGARTCSYEGTDTALVGAARRARTRCARRSRPPTGSASAS